MGDLGVRDPAVFLFDMDDTILDDTGSAQACWQAACQCYAAQLGAVTPAELLASIDDYREWYWSDPERHRVGRLNLEQARRDIVITAAQRLGLDAPEVACQIADYYSAARDRLIAPFPGALDTLQTLRDRGARLGLITNGNAVMQRCKIDRFGLAPYFDCIVIEGEFGAGKPDLRVYRHALDQFHAASHETWMIGDNLEWDVAAPQQLGIFGVWNDYTGKGLPARTPVRPDLIIRSLTELISPGG